MDDSVGAGANVIVGDVAGDVMGDVVGDVVGGASEGARDGVADVVAGAELVTGKIFHRYCLRNLVVGLVAVIPTVPLVCMIRYRTLPSTHPPTPF
jgi:hypothetical protein